MRDCPLSSLCHRLLAARFSRRGFWLRTAGALHVANARRTKSVDGYGRVARILTNDADFSGLLVCCRSGLT